MKNIVFVNILLNLGLTAVSVILNSKVLENGLEETFVSLALIYGVVVVFANAIFVAKFVKSR